MKDEDIYKQIKALFTKDNKFFNTKKIVKLLDDHCKVKLIIVEKYGLYMYSYFGMKFSLR